MLRARRLCVAVVASLTIGSLAACRSEPDVGAYLGAGQRITVAQVQEVVDDARDKLAARPQQDGASAAPPAAGPVSLSGPDVMSTLITHDVLMRIAGARGVKVPDPLPLEQYGQQLGLPADARYVRLYTENEGLIYQLMQKVQPARPTADDVRGVFDALNSAGAVQPGVSLEQFTSSLSEQAQSTLGAAIALRNEVRADVEKQDIRVNPRYQPTQIVTYSERTNDGKLLKLVTVPVAGADGPVTDLS